MSAMWDAGTFQRKRDRPTEWVALNGIEPSIS
jgi:hypothetical protein